MVPYIPVRAKIFHMLPDLVGYLSVNSHELFSVSFTLLILSQLDGDDVIVTYY